jgi:mono/diheme cytochrome c family protein
MIKKISFFIGLAGGAFGWLAFTQEDTLEQSMKRGEDVYAANCAGCHQPNGEGVESVFPPLANTVYLKDQKLIIGIVLNGQSGEINVDGKQYNTPMNAMHQLSDKEIADVLNFVSNSWGNKNPMIKPDHVKAERK